MIRAVAFACVCAVALGCGDDAGGTAGASGTGGSAGAGGMAGSAGTGGAPPSLTIGDVAPQQCVGSELFVTYTLQGGATGTLELQLSGSDGVFDEDTIVLGSVADASGSGEVSGEILSGAELGGTYRVRLVLNTDELISESTTEFGLNPYNPPSEVGPESDSFFNLVGEPFSFSANTMGAASYHWDFGNGTTSTEENPQATYASTGIYDVELVAATDLGCTSSDSTEVVVVSCDATIPDSASVVTDTGSMVGGGGLFENWVCDGGEITGGMGGAYSFWVEDGGEVTVSSGGLFIIHAKSGSTINYGSGGAFAILREAGATLNTGGGGLVQIFDCDSVDFDLTSAPSPGCP